ncbi:dynamin family protein [Priestia sp. SB1]|uniref:dynamin family protein n=1 Tax=Priestia sp. SB1 TaxID=3132359 RepID=UPI0031774F00
MEKLSLEDIIEKLNLKKIREIKGFTQSELAKLLGISKDYYVELEEDPKDMPMDIFMKLGFVTDMSRSDLLAISESSNELTSNLPKLSKPTMLNLPNVYENISFKRRTLLNYVKPTLERYSNKEDKASAVLKTKELIKLTNAYSAKPLVALLGPSDAGKSTLINSLTGLDTLLSQWTPTTSSTVYLKHLQDKPEWLGEDNVCIFKAESKKNGWNFRNIYDEEYCVAHKIASGDYSTLEKYCNRNTSYNYKEVDSAVVYIDSPVLHACDIVDLPGFGTEELNDTIQSQRAREQADVVLFLCQSNSFLNKMNDILFLKDVIKNLASTNSSEIPLLSNLYVIASQAYIIEKDVDKVLNRGRDVMSQQLSEEIIKQFYGKSKDEFVEALSKRFFTYSLEKPILRKSFEEDLTNLLTNIFPPIKTKKLNEEIENYKVQATRHYTIEIKKVEKVLENRQQAQEEYNERMKSKPEAVNQIKSKKKVLEEQIKLLKINNQQELRLWEQSVLTKKNLVSMINEHNYNKKNAQEFLPSNVSDLYYAKLQEILRDSTDKIQDQITEFFNELEGITKAITKIQVEGTEIPLDFKGILSGGFAGATVLGALGFWASTVGNLGGYILVAKGVSLLSAVGISVGGTAAAASFVSIIGGPITIGIGIALGAFLLVKGLFGDGWKPRIAENLIKAFKKQNVLEKYEEVITLYWDDTITAVDFVVEDILEKIEEQLEQIKNIIISNDINEVKESVNELREMEIFFSEIPWEVEVKQLTTT